jgi:serine/threonine protein kinase
LTELIYNQAKKPLLKNVVYDDHLALKLAVDVACGLVAIHAEGLFHSDIKVHGERTLYIHH